jgi:gliding motility-associated-like protein
MSYTLATIDSCINTGLINEKPQHTIYLKDTLIRCEHSVYLSWYFYNHWINGVEGYDIYIAKNGGASILYESLSSNRLTDTISDLNDGDVACITIVATEKVTGFTSVSNEVCILFNVVQPAKDFYVRNVTVEGSDSIKISFSMNSLADITGIDIERSLDSINFSLLKTIAPPADLSITNTFLDVTALTSELSYYYRMIATDSCGNKDTSTIGKSILLKGYAFSDLTFYNGWDESFFDFGSVQQYDVHRDDGSGYNLITSVGDDVFVYEEKNIPTITPCYFIESKVTMDFPNGIKENIFSRSNKICLNQPSQIYVANAFAPGGQNNIFKPILNVDVIKNYSFQVFNRWGEQLFSTTSPAEGWNGKYKGAYVQQGAYAYNISLTDGYGKALTSNGSVLVVK